jgi:hypothetical protein
MSRKYRGLTRINGIWHIDKQIKGHGRLCESTSTDDEDEAGLYLGKRLKEIRDARVHGTRPKRTFREAATRYLNENAHRRGIARDAAALKDMDEALGESPVNIMDLYIDEMHDGSFTAYREARRNPTKPRTGRKSIKPLSNGTLNRHASVVKCVLEDAATKWRDEMSNLTWLAQSPYINCTLPHKKRPPYPLSWEEQRLMFDELQPHSQRMSEFCTNTGARGSRKSVHWSGRGRSACLNSTSPINRASRASGVVHSSSRLRWRRIGQRTRGLGCLSSTMPLS